METDEHFLPICSDSVTKEMVLSLKTNSWIIVFSLVMFKPGTSLNPGSEQSEFINFLLNILQILACPESVRTAKEMI